MATRRPAPGSGSVSVPIAPTLRSFDEQDPRTDAWFRNVNNRMTTFQGTTNPTTADIPEGQWIVFVNTALNEVRIWTNDRGTVKKTVAFT